MIEKIIGRYLKVLLKNNIISMDEIESYKYHATCFLESFIVIVTMFAIGMILHESVNICVFIICFFSIRNRAGGFHLDTFPKCFFGTVALECLIIALVKFLKNKMIIIDILTVILFIVILSFGALNHPNMNYTRNEYISVKNVSRVTVTVVCSLIVFLKLLNASDETILFMEYAVILSGVLLVLGYITGQHC